jgi:hypothetical protein
MAVKDYVRQQLYGEMEPIRVQVAVLQKQLQELDVKTQGMVVPIGGSPGRNNSRGSDLSEKKLEEMSPRLENWMTKQESDLGETNNRLAEAERVLRDLGAGCEKFTQRHDSLFVFVQDLDRRIDDVDKAAQANHQEAKFNHQQVLAKAVTSAPMPHNSPLPTPDHHGGYAAGPLPIPTPAWAPSPLASPGGQPISAAAAAAAGLPQNKWTASDQSASLEVEEFNFQVDRKPGMSLGMILRNDGSKLVVDKISEGSSVPVTLGDRVVAIDGIRGDSKVLLELVRRTGKFKITCQRLLSTTL